MIGDNTGRGWLAQEAIRVSPNASCAWPGSSRESVERMWDEQMPPKRASGLDFETMELQTRMKIGRECETASTRRARKEKRCSLPSIDNSPNKVAVWRSASLGPSGFTALLRAGVKREGCIFSLCSWPWSRSMPRKRQAYCLLINLRHVCNTGRQLHFSHLASLYTCRTLSTVP